MNNREKSFLQKLKDNAFYISLSLGLLAILAVVAVYTAQQNEAQLAENSLDLNVASDYASISTEMLREDIVAETDAEVVTEKDEDGEVSADAEDGKITDEGAKKITAEDGETTDEGVTAGGGETIDEDAKKITAEDGETTDEGVTAGDGDITGEGAKETTATGGEISDEETGTAGNSESKGKSDTAEKNNSAETDSIPVTVDAGELNFNSEKTITWPVNGEVILPYSMETTVYFKTLDQYQCNPGMLIKAGNGSTVQNAYLGQVTKVTSDDTYGNLVTLYIGNDYSIVYGQLDTIYVKEGDFVKAGQSIGTVGNPTDCFKEEGSHLFFQMLEGEQTVDPMLYIE